MILHLSVSHSVHRVGRDPPPPHRDPPYRDHPLPVYGKERVVRILLECILVFVYEYSFRFTFTVILEGEVARHIGPLTVGYPPSDAVFKGRIARIVWFSTGPFRPRSCKPFVRPEHCLQSGITEAKVNTMSNKKKNPATYLREKNIFPTGWYSSFSLPHKVGNFGHFFSILLQSSVHHGTLN